MNISTAVTRTPKWYLPIVIVALLWNLLGCLFLAIELFAQDAAIASMTEPQQEWVRSTPGWIYVIYAIGLTTGVAGSIGLLARKTATTTLFAISLVAVVVQMTYTMGIAGGFEVMGPSGLIMPAVVVVIAALLFGLSRFGKKAGWLSR